MLSLTINVLLTTVLLPGAVDMPMKVAHNSYSPDTRDMTKKYALAPACIFFCHIPRNRVITINVCVCVCVFVCVSHPKTACSCKKSARPSKAELTATKSNDIIMWPCARCESCKINI